MLNSGENISTPSTKTPSMLLAWASKPCSSSYNYERDPLGTSYYHCRAKRRSKQWGYNVAYKQAWDELTELMVLLETSQIEIISILFLLRLMNMILLTHTGEKDADENA